jgi:hypothetical protein
MKIPILHLEAWTKSKNDWLIPSISAYAFHKLMEVTIFNFFVRSINYKGLLISPWPNQEGNKLQ